MRVRACWLWLLAAIGVVGLGNMAAGRAVNALGDERGSTVKQSGDSEPSQAIRAVLSAQQAAWNQGDIPAFLKGYWNSPELTFSGSDGIVRGYDGLLARYKKTYPDKAAMGELDFTGLEIRPLGSDAALVLGKWHLQRASGPVGGVFTLVFRRFPDGWRIIHDHTNQGRDHTS